VVLRRPAAGASAGWLLSRLVRRIGQQISVRYDKTNLPDEVILTHYFTVRDGKIARLIIIRNAPVAS
jgi:hypothetical protein